MIPKSYRLTLSPSKPIRGNRFRGHWLTTISRPHVSPQWAISVSKKIDGRAVVRNRLRRQIYQWLYKHRAEIKPQQALIILNQLPATKTDLDSLFTEINQLLGV